MTVNKAPVRNFSPLLLALVMAVLFSLGFFGLQAATAAGISIQGRVLDGEGKAVAGATASLVSPGSQFEVGERQMEGYVDLAPAATVKVDGEGRFRLEAPELGLWRVLVQAPGYRSLAAPLSPLFNDQVLPPARLAEARDLVVEVRGANGAAVPDALVVGESATEGRRGRRTMGASRRGPWGETFLYGRTDDTGKVRLHPAVDATVKVHAWAPGYLPSKELGAVEVAGTVARVQLASGVERTLEVRDYRGRPAPGVLVQVSPFGWPAGWTDAAGRMTVMVPGPATPEESLAIALHSETTWVSGLSLAMPPRPPASDEAGTTRKELPPQIFSLPEARSLNVTVVDRDTKKPIPGAFVWSASGKAFTARADRSGACSLPVGPAQGRVTLRAAALGYQVKHQTISGDGSGTTISLPPAVLLEGRVVDDAGRPLAGVEVSADPGGGGFFFEPEGLGMVTTGEDGSFRLRGLQPISAYRVEASLRGFAPASVEAVTPDVGGAASEALEVVLLPGRLVFGLVVDEGEVPIPGVQVQLNRTVEGTGRRALARAFGPGRSMGEILTTDSTGRFEATDVAAGRYDLHAERAGFAPVTVRGVEVPSGGGETELGTVILAPGVHLELRVVDQEKLPVEGAHVQVQEGAVGTFVVRYGSSEGTQEATTDLDGRITLGDLAAGSSVGVDVTKEGFQSRNLSGIQVPQDAPLEVVLERSFRVSGRILGPDGEPVSRGWAALDDGRAEVSVGGRRFGMRMFEYRAISEEDGGFEILGVPPGKYTLEASARGFLSSLPVELEVEKKDLQGITATLRVGATVRGRVFSPQGTAVADARIAAARDPQKPSGMGSRGSAVTSESGAYSLEGVEPGEQTLEASHEQYVRSSKTLQVKAGENHLDFTLKEGSEVQGRVVASTGEPVAGAQVQLVVTGSQRATRIERSVSTADGSFRFSSVAAGRYRVKAEKEGFAPATSEREIQVDLEPVGGVEVVLQEGTMVVGQVTGLEFDALSSLQIMAHDRSGGMALAAVDYRGDYRLGPLGPGTWIVRATAGIDGRQVLEQMVVEEGVAQMQLDLDFAGGFELRGRVLRGGKPLEGGRIFVQGLDGGSSGSGATDFEGRFRLGGLKSGRYHLSVLHMESGIQHSQEVTLDGDEDIEVDLGSAMVSGLVRSGVDGAPIAGVSVELQPVADRPGPGFGLARTVETDGEGRFVFEGISEGSWRVTAKEGGFSPAEQVLNVTAAGMDDLELTLQPTEGLQVDVFHADGRPASSVEALLTDAAGTVVAQGRFRASEAGRFHFDTAPPGRWRLQVAAGRDAADGLASVEVPGPPVQVRIPPPGWLSLRVPELEASGLVATMAIAGSDGVSYLPMGRRNIAMTGAFPLLLGRLDRLPLPPGSWTVTVTTPDGRTWSATATIRAEATAEVVLE